nr:ORF1 [Torque teno felis virus]
MFRRRRWRRWTKKRWGRRRGYRRWGRWRRHRRGRRLGVYKRFVTQNVPGRHRYIWVRGWEPLANICSNDCASTEATPYKSIEPQGGLNGQWHGTWGKHYFTPGNLILRALARWNVWSDDWASYDYIEFYGGTVRIPQTAQCQWMITFDEYLETQANTYNPKTNEDKWGHPGVLLNMPKTHIIFPYTQIPRKRFYKMRVSAPPGWRGAQRFPDAMSYICFHWLWSYCDLIHAFYDVAQNKPGSQDTCPAQPWWVSNGKQGNWVDRSKYPTCTNNQQQNNWGPFLPGTYTNYECSLFFLYKLKFKVVGNAIWRPLPRNFAKEGMVPDPPSSTREPGTSKASLKRGRPQSEYDIWPGDLDSQGILTKEAFERITADSGGVKRRKLGRERRLRHLVKVVRGVVERYGLLKRQQQ